MRLKIELLRDKEIILPRGYNQFLQAVVYTHLNEKEAKWLHEHGFAYEKRKFRHFVISEIRERGKYSREKRIITYPPRISFFVSSPVDWILEQVAKNILSSEFVMLGRNRLSISSVSVEKTPEINSNSIKVRTLSPIETHSTFNREDGGKQTHYYTPFEGRFSELVNSNLQKKWQTFFNEDCPYDLKLKPLFKGNRNEKIRFFKNTVIKGCDGYFRLEGDPEILKFAVKIGLGSRNSMGFGMVDVVG